MEFDQQPLYEAPPPRPVLWIGLTTFFALCCCCFAFVAMGEGVILATGGLDAWINTTSESSSNSSAKPTIGTIRFCVETPETNTACSPSVSKVPTSTKTIYATFDYKNMPKNSTYTYEWASDDAVTGKEKVKWPKETNGIATIKLEVSKPGEYRLTIMPTSGDEKEATLKVGQ
jgi:hypothetical protein